jgi:NADH-quinone oxidoreductase subunit G
VQHPQATTLLALANWIGAQTGASVGVMGAAANTVGAQLVKARPGQGGRSAAQLLNDQPAKALVLLNTDPVLDGANAAAAAKAVAAAEMVVVLSPFKTGLAYADVLLPAAPFTETSGSFVNAEGRLQSFVGVVKARGETRPAWKILRVLGNLLGLSGFDFDSSEQVRNAALGVSTELGERLSNVVPAAPAASASVATGGLERLTAVPIYATDALVRRASSLQLTRDGRDAAVAGLPQALWTQLGLEGKGAQVRVAQAGAGEAVLAAQLDTSLPATVVRVPAGVPETAALGALFGAISVTKA